MRACLFCCLLLAGCASTTWRNPATGQQANCGPRFWIIPTPVLVVWHYDGCAKAHETAGWEPVPHN